MTVAPGLLFGSRVVRSKAEEADGDDRPEVETTDDLHDRTRGLLVFDRGDTPQCIVGLVRLVDDTLGEGQPAGRHRGNDRHEEEVEHLPGLTHLEFLERADDREPHEQRRREHQQVDRVVERAVVRRQIHHSTPVGEDLQRIEDGACNDRLGEHPQNPLGRAVVENDEAGQPRRHRQQEQRRDDEADQQVLQHVNEVQVLLGDVVHRPVGGEPQHGHTDDEEPLLVDRGDRLPCRHHEWSDVPDRIDPQADDRSHQQPHFRVELVVPRARSE